ncbi:MAG: hypothetical protein RR376_20440, partial [Janthinobacterium sp.]
MSLPIMAAFLPALGWVLLYFVWQGLLIGGAAAVGLWLLRDAGPRWRYALCALALLLCLGMPAAHLLALLLDGGPAQARASVAALPAWRSAVAAWLPALVL